MRMLSRILLAVSIFCLVQATAAQAQDEGVNDPLEGLNRATHSFNDKLDLYLLRPVAMGWKRISPEIVRESFRNFDDNIGYPVIAINDILQWKWRAFGEQTARFAINSTVGILGFRDPASEWGFAKQYEDTGQTLGSWGVPPGPYLVLPLYGPSNIRDGIGLLADSFLGVYWIVAPFYVSIPYSAADVVNRRSLDELIDNSRKAALDHYVFTRNAYTQRREALIRDMEDSETDDDLHDLEDDLYELDDEE